MNRDTRNGLALVGAMVFVLTLFPVQRALVEETPARVALHVWPWLPSRLSSGVLAAAALLGAAAVLALVVHLLWLAVRPTWGRDLAWRSLGHASRCQPLGRRKDALVADANRLLVVLVATSIVTGLAYFTGRSRRLEVDLDAWHYQRTWDYLGTLRLRQETRPAWEVVEASLVEERHVDPEDHTVTYTYAVAFLLMNGTTHELAGPEAACRQAVAAFERLLARRRSSGLRPGFLRS